MLYMAIEVMTGTGLAGCSSLLLTLQRSSEACFCRPGIARAAWGWPRGSAHGHISVMAVMAGTSALRPPGSAHNDGQF
eukprot:scaffold306348_cov15-Tisochrysis_lutea.AAC.1